MKLSTARPKKHQGHWDILSPIDMFSHLSQLLVGPQFDLETQEADVFMMSDFGWTISLPTYGDSDPSDIDVGSLCVYEGTPTNSKTLERKTCVRDGQAEFGLRTIPERLKENLCNHNEGTFLPRCVSPVHSRTELIGSRLNGFHVALRIRGTNLVHRNGKEDQLPFECSYGYRLFFESLWNASIAPSCVHDIGERHDEEISSQVSIDEDVVTTLGPWNFNIYPSVKEKIAIVLVKGDRWARCLAVVASRSHYERASMVLGSDCCVQCAVTAAFKKELNWWIII